VVGISGSFAVAAFGMRVNTFANSRTAFAALRGKAFPCYDIPLQAGMSIGMLLVSVELLIMLFILLFVPGDLAGACFIGFAIGESLGAAALRVAGGIFTKIADIGSDLMKIVFKIKEDDARNPGVIADCTGDNAGDSVGPSADGFETYGVTGVALITFILLAVHSPVVQVQLLVWIFSMRVMMVISSAVGYFINGAVAKARFGNLAKFNFETPLTTLVWLTSILSIALTYVLSAFMIPSLGGDTSMWWKLATVISCGTLAGALIPEFVKVFTSTNSRHVREIVTSSREGGASLNILSGFVAGNFSAYWLGFTMLALMSVGYYVSTMFPPEPHALMLAPAVFAFGLVAFGFLGMGPVTIAVDSYGPVTDNAQSVYELSMIETIPDIAKSIEKEFGFTPDFEKAKENLEENDGAGNTGAYRHGRGGRHHHDLLHRRGPYARPGRQVYEDDLADARAVSAGYHRRRRGDLLVHRGQRASRHHGRLPRRRVHQEEHQAGKRREGIGGRFQEGGGYLHAVRAEGHVEHLPGGIFRNALVRVPGAVFLRGIPHLHRVLRPVSSALHGQCRRRLG
jgi:K(+)-stimulated pyrophosphate-energized sodium pump